MQAESDPTSVGTNTSDPIYHHRPGDRHRRQKTPRIIWTMGATPGAVLGLGGGLTKNTPTKHLIDVPSLIQRWDSATRVSGKVSGVSLEGLWEGR